MDAEPTVSAADAAEMCEQVYDSRSEAIAAARRLRAAGWIVPLLNEPVEPVSTSTRMVAIVYHPDTYDSPGEVRYHSPD